MYLYDGNAGLAVVREIIQLCMITDFALESEMMIFLLKVNRNKG